MLFCLFFILAMCGEHFQDLVSLSSSQERKEVQDSAAPHLEYRDEILRPLPGCLLSLQGQDVHPYYTPPVHLKVPAPKMLLLLQSASG